MSKHVLRALGVSLLAALSLMAFAAAGAQAANLTAPFTTAGISILGNDTLKATVTGEAEGTGQLLVPSLGIEISCTSFDVNEGVVNETLGHGKIVVLFLGCKVFPIEKVLPFKLTSETALPCLPLDVKNGEDGSIHASALVLAVEHEGKSYLIAENIVSEIVFTPGLGCPIPLKPVVTGSAPFLIESGDLKGDGTAVTKVLVKADGHALPPLFGTKTLYGSNEAFLDGAATFAAAEPPPANLTAPFTTAGISILGNDTLNANVTAVAEGTGQLLVPNLGMEISCASFDVNEGVVNETLGHGKAVVLFLGCKVFPIEKVLPFNLTSETALPCLPLDVKNGEDGSIHASALVLAIKHEGKSYLIAENLLTEIIFSPGTGCSIPLKQVVAGALPLLIEKGDLNGGGAAVTKVLIKADGHSLPPLFGTKLLYGVNEAFLDGAANMELVGAHVGCTWGII